MLGQLIRSLADLTEPYVPRWAWIVGVLVLAALAWPSVRRSTKAEAARKHFRTAVRYGYEERLRREDEAIAMMGEDIDGLVTLADLALAEGRPRIVSGLVERVRASGKRPDAVKRLTVAVEGPLPGSAMEAVILVERFWAQGQQGEARKRLARARERWPNDEDLDALALRLDAPAAGEGGG